MTAAPRRQPARRTSVFFGSKQPAEDGLGEQLGSVPARKLRGGYRVERNRLRSLDPGFDHIADRIRISRVDRYAQPMSPHLLSDDTVVSREHGDACRRGPNEDSTRPDRALVGEEREVAAGKKPLNLRLGYEAIFQS